MGEWIEDLFYSGLKLKVKGESGGVGIAFR